MSETTTRPLQHHSSPAVSDPASGAQPSPAGTRRKPRRGNRLILNDVDWQTYTRLLHALDERHLRLTYDRGVLEIMTLSYRHESVARFLGRLAVTLSEEFDLPIREGGSTTLRRPRRQKGLEPDNCYWIKNASQIQGKTKIDLRTDPPPDLAIEVDVTHSSLNRMEIYAKLAIPEVWRLDDKGLTFHVLGTDKNFAEVPE
ncbi:MAG: Uma2 family endonuclease, partial [Planctomycetes bacterium]|nr:Uma2 family endonuclease [Planctomycetota bacterium]